MRPQLGGSRLSATTPNPARAGRAALYVVELSVVLVILYWFSCRHDTGKAESQATVVAQAEAPAEERIHSGFEAETERGGTTLRVRFSPLHPAPERQAFETRTLGKLFGLDAGMPWRLELIRGEELENEPATRLRMEGLGDQIGVRDGSTGNASEGFEPLPVERLTAASPLVPLLRPATRTLGPGETRHVVLWGPAAVAEPRLVGLGSDVELAAATWPALGVDEALLRLEPIQ